MGVDVELEGGANESNNKIIPEGLKTLSHNNINLTEKKKSLHFVTPKEKEDYYYMKKHIEGPNNTLSQKGITNLINHIFFNR